MYKGKKILCFIPARGKSKSLPGKNIRSLFGRPLIAWSIEEAKKSGLLDEIIVSTDNKRIAVISKKYGAKVPFMRPKYLATSTAKGVDAVLHALKWLERRKKRFDLVMVLQPTSPLRRAIDINRAIRIFFKRNAKSIVSVCKTEHCPAWSNTLPKDNSLRRFLKKDIINRNRQELPQYYRLNGAIYLASCNYLKRHGTFLGRKSFAYEMPQERSVDIDSLLDFVLAEAIIRRYRRTS